MNGHPQSPSSASTEEPTADDVGTTTNAQLLEWGLAPSRYILDLNNTLAVPHEMALPPPWDLPSRLFRFPIELGDVAADGTRSIGLMHPHLSEHPFVQHVSATLGMPLNLNGAPNVYGVSKQPLARWWHAVDLVSAGMWRELIATRRFTTDTDIASAVAYGLDYSPCEGARHGYLATKEAREIMRAIEAVEPADRRAAIRLAIDTPQSCRGEKGCERWPINARRNIDPELRAWARIIGIEIGWFAYDRSGVLQWSPTGRDRHGAADATTFVESATGQAAFDF